LNPPAGARVDPSQTGSDFPDRTRPKEEQVKHLTMAITAALMLGTLGASSAAATTAADNHHRVDRRIHQHQGIGPTAHPHGHRKR
jgi:hypothetical protein